MRKKTAPKKVRWKWKGKREWLVKYWEMVTIAKEIKESLKKKETTVFPQRYIPFEKRGLECGNKHMLKQKSFMNFCKNLFIHWLPFINNGKSSNVDHNFINRKKLTILLINYSFIYMFSKDFEMFYSTIGITDLNS